MIKKIFALLILATCLLSACGGTTQPTEGAHEDTQGIDESEVLSGTESSTILETGVAETSSDSIEVDTGLFDVELTIPANLIGDVTQEDLDEICDEYGFQSITLNADGSATYIMTEQQHQDLLDEYRDQINADLTTMVGSEDYPTFTNITANDDFTEFTVTTTSTELSMQESFSTIQFYLYGGLYGAFNGTPENNISVVFINADSGEIIQTANSSEMSE